MTRWNLTAALPMPVRRRAPAFIMLLGALGLLIAAASWLAGHVAERKLTGDLERQLGSSLDVYASGLVGDLAGYPAALTLLSSDPRVLRAVIVGDDTDIENARNRLQHYADLSRADSAMIIDADGRLIADHADDPARSLAMIDWLMAQPGFDAALNGGLGRAFGIADGFGARRYVFIRRISRPAGEPALLVIAISLAEIELIWRLAGRDILVVDRRGSVMLSSDRSRLFETLGPVPKNTEKASVCREHALTVPEDQLCVAKTIARLGWDMYLIGDRVPVHGQVRLVRWVTALSLFSLALLIGVFWERRSTLQRTLHIKEDSNRQLQRRVELRTSELKQANQQLQVEIDERIVKEQALREAQAELVQASKLAALGQLSAGIAHELNQPLAALRAYADNARTLLARGKPETASDNLILIGDLTDRMAKMTKDLKILARRQPTRTERIELPPLVRAAINQIRKTRDADPVDILYDAEPVELFAEPVGLQQVLGNLLQNGLDAMEAAPESLRQTANDGQASPPGKKISIETGADDDRVRLSIADNGPGIDPAALSSIFDPFFTTKEVGKGLGLGLSLSVRMVEDMGGKLLASNRAEGGACFTIELKRATGRPGAAQGGGEVDSGQGTKGRDEAAE